MMMQTNTQIALKYLTEVEEITLFKNYKENNCLKSVEKLIVNQLGYVSKLSYQYRSPNVPIEDIFQEGVIGLMKAIANFDLKYGVRLISYAIPYIKSAMIEYSVKHIGIVKTITSKAHRKVLFNINKMREDSKKLSQNDIKTIANELKVSEYDVIDINTRLYNKDYSLDYCILEDGTPVVETIIDGNYKSYLDIREYDEKFEAIHEAIATLDARQKYIFLSRNLSEIPVRLEALGKELNISSQRVAQLEIVAMQKVKQYVLGKLGE